MSSPDFDQLFGRRIVLPDTDAQSRLSRLVGRDEAIARLSKLLGILICPARLEKWRDKYHPDSRMILTHVQKRHPLVILSGDVGTGKTELAETIGDKVARDEKIEIVLFPMSLSARGGGLVGEMTKLVSGAFAVVEEESAKISRNKKGAYAGGVLLLIDEADALAQSRETSQMHHEDRAGVNALIRGLDTINRRHLPAAVMMCTNRLSAIDPAVQRRAADIFVFARPNDEQRYAVLSTAFEGFGFAEEQIREIVELTGKSNGAPAFTFSDLTHRFLSSVVMDAYPDSPVTFKRVKEVLSGIRPTAPFEEQK